VVQGLAEIATMQDIICESTNVAGEMRLLVASIRRLEEMTLLAADVSMSVCDGTGMMCGLGWRVWLAGARAMDVGE
jgi:hypothetical protein